MLVTNYTMSLTAIVNIVPLLEIEDRRECVERFAQLGPHNPKDAGVLLSACIDYELRDHIVMALLMFSTGNDRRYILRTWFEDEDIDEDIEELIELYAPEMVSVHWSGVVQTDDVDIRDELCDIGNCLEQQDLFPTLWSKWKNTKDDSLMPALKYEDIVPPSINDIFVDIFQGDCYTEDIYIEPIKIMY